MIPLLLHPSLEMQVLGYWVPRWKPPEGSQEGLGLQAEEQEEFPSQGLKTAALCYSTSSCFFLAEKQSKKPPPFIWQTNKGLASLSLL